MGVWQERAACRDHDPDLFFPEGTSRAERAKARRAKAVCATCPVLVDCRREALQTSRTVGVWGGMWIPARFTEAARAGLAAKMQPVSTERGNG